MTKRTKKVLIPLDFQKKKFSSAFSGIYNIAADAQNAFEYRIRILPIIKRTGKKHEVVIVTLDHRAEQRLGREGLSFRSRRDVTTNLFNARMLNKSKDFVKTLDKIFGKHDPSTIYDNLSMLEFNNYEILFSFLSRVIYCIEAAEETIKEEKPDQVLLLNRNSVYQRAFAEVAKRENIPVIDKTSFLSSLSKKMELFLIKKLGSSNIPKTLRKIQPSNEKKKGEKPLIIVTHDSIGPGKVLPWLTRIDKNKFDTIFVGITPNGAEYKKKDISYTILSRYGTKKIKKSIKQKKSELKFAYKKICKNKEFKKDYNYKGIPLWNLSKELIIFLYHARFLYSVTIIELMREMIKREKPNAIVSVDNLSKYGHTLLGICEQEKTLSILVQHGLIIKETMVHPSIATKMLVYGQQTVDALLNSGSHQDQIEITGQCEGKESTDKNADREYICKIAGAKKEKPIVVFISQSSFESFDTPLYKLIYNTMSKLPEVQFITKLHPDEGIEEHKKYMKKFDLKNVKIIKDIDLQKTITGCDFVLNILSTVGIEALRTGTRVISVNATNIPLGYYPKQKENISELVRTSEELERTIHKFLNDKEDREKEIIEFGKYYIKEIGENASRKIAKEIEKNSQ